MPKVGVLPCGSYGDHGFDSKLTGMRVPRTCNS